MESKKYRIGDRIELTVLFPRFSDLTRITTHIADIYPFGFMDSDGRYHHRFSYLEDIDSGRDNTGPYILVSHGRDYLSVSSVLDDMKKTLKNLEKVQREIREMRSYGEHGNVTGSLRVPLNWNLHFLNLYDLSTIPVFGKSRISGIQRIENSSKYNQCRIIYYNLGRNTLRFDSIAEFLDINRNHLNVVFDDEYEKMDALVKEYHRKREKLLKIEQDIWRKRQKIEF